MRVFFIFILFFVSGYSCAQGILPPDYNLFKDPSGDTTNINPKQAYGVLQVSMEVRQPIETDVSDDMKYLNGIVVDVETREIEESNVVLKEAKITVNADPSGNYKVLLDDQSINSDKSLTMSLTDKQDKRTLSTSGSDTFQVSGVFVNDSGTESNIQPQKSITVVYDSV